MPTSTLNHNDLIAHVPVDLFQIVNGAGALKCMEAQESLHMHANDSDYFVEMDFTLKTLASDTSFKRTLKVYAIFGVVDGGFSFTAIFSGQVVSGLYDMKTRTGWFNLD